MAVSDPNGFAERVNYAARCILNGRTNSRAFDACFENDDAHVVAAAVYRRALRNLTLAAKIFQHIDREMTLADHEKYKGVPTRKLASAARQARADRQAEREQLDKELTAAAPEASHDV